MKMTLLNAFLGFVAAAVAVVVFHQGLVFLFHETGLVAQQPWSFEPHGPWEVPRLASQMFWGGAWGALYGLTWHRFPGHAAWIKGVFFGLLVVILGNFVVVPLLKDQPLFMGMDVARILTALVVHLVFGMGTAVIFDYVERRIPPFD